MNETHERRHRGVHPLMLVFGTLMLSRAIHRHHRMGGHAGPGERSFRVPPKIQAFLDEWHAQAHKASDAAEAVPPPTA
jgi:hypothetical protein